MTMNETKEETIYRLKQEIAVLKKQVNDEKYFNELQAYALELLNETINENKKQK